MFAFVEDGNFIHSYCFVHVCCNKDIVLFNLDVFVEYDFLGEHECCQINQVFKVFDTDKMLVYELNQQALNMHNIKKL